MIRRLFVLVVFGVGFSLFASNGANDTGDGTVVPTKEYKWSTEREALDRGIPLQNERNRDYKTFEWIRHHYFQLFTVGPGVNAIAINCDSWTTDILDSVSVVQVTFNWWQRGLVHWREAVSDPNKDWIGTPYHFSVGPSIGLVMNYSDETFRIGFHTTVDLRIGDFTIGFGGRFINEIGSKIEFLKGEHWSLVIPISYQLSFGG